MSSLLHPLLSLHGPAAYLLVAALVFGEAALFLGFIFPGETAIIYGGVLASQHHVSLIGMILLAVACATLGYTVGYEVGRHFGPFLLRHRPLAGRESVARTQAIVRRRGATAVFVGRFLPVVRALVPGVAGMSGVTYRHFQAVNIAGGVVWATGWTIAGFLVGNAYNHLLHDATTVSLAVAGLVVALVAVHLLRHRRGHRGEIRPARSTIDTTTGIIDNATIPIRDEESHMALQLGDVVPDFTADSTEGQINFHEYLGDGWGILFSHPRDFTPVCTTELGEVSRLKSEFDKRNVKVVGLSVDPVDSHKGWTSDIKDATGQELNFPLLGDPDHKVADLYGMIHPNASDTMTVRSVFVIGPDKKLKLEITYPASTGRNFEEILRVIDSLQLTAKYSVATPVNWKDGDDVIITTAVSDDDAKTRFPKGFTAVKPYLRYTPQPNR